MMNPLIDPKEAVAISAKAPINPEADTAFLVAKAAIEHYSKKFPFLSQGELYLFSLHAVFHAGRIYGVRRERARRKGGAR